MTNSWTFALVSKYFLCVSVYWGKPKS